MLMLAIDTASSAYHIRMTDDQGPSWRTFSDAELPDECQDLNTAVHSYVQSTQWTVTGRDDLDDVFQECVESANLLFELPILWA